MYSDFLAEVKAFISTGIEAKEETDKWNEDLHINIHDIWIQSLGWFDATIVSCNKLQKYKFVVIKIKKERKILYWKVLYFVDEDKWVGSEDGSTRQCVARLKITKNINYKFQQWFVVRCIFVTVKLPPWAVLLIKYWQLQCDLHRRIQIMFSQEKYL